MKVKMKIKIKYKAFYLKPVEQPEMLCKPSPITKPTRIIIPVYNPFNVVYQP